MPTKGQHKEVTTSEDSCGMTEAHFEADSNLEDKSTPNKNRQK